MTLTAKKKTDLLREHYYKAKASPSISRGLDGSIDDQYTMTADGRPMQLRELIDQCRRDPEDNYSMDDAWYKRNMEDIDHANMDCYAYRIDNMAYKAYHIVDSKQCRKLV